MMQNVKTTGYEGVCYVQRLIICDVFTCSSPHKHVRGSPREWDLEVGLHAMFSKPFERVIKPFFYGLTALSEYNDMRNNNGFLGCRVLN